LAKIKENAKSERPAAATTKLFLAPLPRTFSYYRFLSLTCLFLSLVSTRKINEKSNKRSAVVIRQRNKSRKENARKYQYPVECVYVCVFLWKSEMLKVILYDAPRPEENACVYTRKID